MTPYPSRKDELKLDGLSLWVARIPTVGRWDGMLRNPGSVRPPGSRLPITMKLPLSLTSFAPGSTARERRAGNF